MKRIRRSFGVLLMIVAILVMQLPIGSAEAAATNDFLTDGSTLVAYRGKDREVTVPSDVTVIGSSSFEENLFLQKVTFPKGLRRIKPYAFWGCDSLKEIRFGNGLKEIGDYAFTSCKGLESLNIPKNITYIGIRSFADCENLTSITLPETVVYIHETAFDGCKHLVIDCPKGSYADKFAQDFYRRQALMEEYEEDPKEQQGAQIKPTEQEESGNTVETIDPEAQAGYLGSTSVVGNRAVFLLNSSEPTVYQGIITKAKQDDYPLKYRIIEDTMIADQAYYKDEELTEIVVPKGIVEIGEFSFARTQAQSLFLPDGVEKIDFGAFYHSDRLREVRLPETIRKVEPKSFQHTAWVRDFLGSSGTETGDFLISGGVLIAYRAQEEELRIPDGVRVIAAEVFKDHTELKKVVFPDSLTDIGEAAFEGCSELSELEWKNGILTIGDRAFAGCPLGELVIPGTLQELGLFAFDREDGLSYLGKEPLRTHENSAERLSNESYRLGNARVGIPNMDDGSVLVLGLTGARASLMGAKLSYTLRLELSQDAMALSKAKAAMILNIGKSLSANAYVLHVSLRDESEIPITRLGKQSLTLGIPFPESFSGQEVAAWRYDRNGQLEPVSVRYLRSGEDMLIVLETDQVFDFVLEGTGKSLGQDQIEDTEIILENNITLAGTENMGHPKDQMENPSVQIDKWMIVKWSAGGILLLLGLFLALSKVK